jgi:replicative DNA helicase
MTTDHNGAGAGNDLSALATLAALDERPAATARAPFSTGFSPLDEVLNGGLRPGDLMVVGGKPGQGKTIATLQWARHVAQDGGTAVVASYEHDPTSLLSRLLACELGEEAAAVGCDDELRLDTLRQRLRALGGGEAGADALAGDTLLLAARERLQEYADRLILVPASGSRTTVDELERLSQINGSERTALIVDYLQKVPVVPEPALEAERVKRVAEALKELALRRGVAVIAVAAADQTGLSGRRVRLHHFRGSTALAYEADVAVVLNNKLAIVSQLHLAYDTTRVYDFRERVVFSVEKNRRGLADVHLEFRKDFANDRFHPRGAWVAERLWEEGSTED